MSYRTISIVFLLLSCLLAGCATIFKANYYFANVNNKHSIIGADNLNSVGSSSNQKMYIAILNQSNIKQKITNVIINPPQGYAARGWQLSQKPLHIELEPGELLVQPASAFFRVANNRVNYFDEQCLLPVAVTVVTDRGSCGCEGVVAEVIGNMPSALPDAWNKKCNKQGHQ